MPITVPDHEPVVDCPDLELQVNLCDGSFSRTRIFRVSGLPEEDRGHGNRPDDRDRETETAIGKFYTNALIGGSLAAYDLPGGTLLMTFTGSNLTLSTTGRVGRTL